MSNLQSVNQISNMDEDKLLDESEYGDEDLYDLNEADEEVLLEEDGSTKDYGLDTQETHQEEDYVEGEELGDGDVLQLQISTDLDLDDFIEEEKVGNCNETCDVVPSRQEKFTKERNWDAIDGDRKSAETQQKRNATNTQRFKKNNINRGGQVRRGNSNRWEERRNRTVLINPRYQGSIEVQESHVRLATPQHIQPWDTNLLQLNHQRLNNFVNDLNIGSNYQTCNAPTFQPPLIFQPPQSSLVLQLQSPPPQFPEQPQWDTYNGSYNVYEQGPSQQLLPQNHYQSDLPPNLYGSNCNNNQQMNYPQQNYNNTNFNNGPVSSERVPFFEPPKEIPSLLDFDFYNNSNFSNMNQYRNDNYNNTNNRRFQQYRNNDMNNTRINKRINNQQQQSIEPKRKFQQPFQQNNYNAAKNNGKILVQVKPTTKSDLNQEKQQTEDTTIDKDYLKKIEEQKRKREEILKLKEKRRLEVIQEQEEKKRREKEQKQETLQIKTIPVVSITRPIIQNIGNVTNLMQTKHNVTSVPIMENAPTNANMLSNRVVYVKPNQNNTNKPVSNNSNSSNETNNNSNFFNNRKILPKDNLMNTRLVLISNLSASTTEAKLKALSKGIGDIQKLMLDKAERQATILFKTVASAHLFFKTYQRHMLDLSMIQVKLEPMI